MRLRTLLYGTILGLGGLLLILGLSLYGLLGTEAGSRWLFEQARSRVPGQLTMDSTRGRFLTNFRIESLRYHNESVEVSTRTVELGWSPLALLTGTFELSHLNIRDTEIRLSASSPASDSTTLPELTLPLSVRLKTLNVQNTTLRLSDESDDFHLENLTGRIHTSGRRIRLRPLSLTADGIRGTMQGWFVPGENYSHDLTISGNYRDFPAGESLSGTLELTGNRTETLLNVRTDAPEKLNASVTVQDPLDELRWSGELTFRDVNTRTYHEGSPVGVVDGTLTGTGTLHSGDLSASLRTNRPGMQTLEVGLRGERTDGGVTVHDFNLRARSEHTPRPVVDVSLGGEYRFDDEFIQAQAQWDPLTFPPFQDPPWLRTSGRLSVSGTRDDYSGTTTARLQTETTGEGHLSSQFRGNRTSLNLANFTAATGEGRLLGHGRIRWVPHLDWTFTLEGSEWSPTLIREDLDGRISFQSQMEGSYENDRLRSQLSLTKLEGTLQGEPLSGRGTLLVDGPRYNLRNLRMTSGDAQFHAQGILDEQWDAEAHLAVTDLDRWDLDLSGSGSMDLTLQGPRSTPRLQGQSSLDNFRTGNYAVEEARLELQVDSDRDRPSAVELQAHNIQAAERTLEKLTVEGDGPIAEHSLHVTTVYQGNRVRFSLDGGMNDGRWAGHIKDLQIQSSDFGHWNQQSPSRLALSEKTGNLAETCLAADQSTLCASLKGGTNGWTGALQAVEVPASRFNPLLRNNVRMDGTVDLNVSGQYSGPRSVELDGDLSLERGSLKYTPDETSDSEVIPVRSTSLTVSLNKNQLSSQLNSDFSEYGQIHGQIQIDTPLPVGSLSDRHFEGTLSGTAAKLSLLHLATDAAQWRSGAVKLDVSGSGPLNNPRLHGSARLETGQVRLVDPGITVENVSGELRADGSSLNYSLSGESGGGTLAIRGSASRSQTRSWETTLQLTGRDFRTVRTEKLKLNTSPDLELSLNYPRVVLRGRVKLPLLDLREVTTLSQDAVTTSEDVRFTHESEPESTQPLSMRTWNFDGLVTIVLGEDVQIREGGFEGGLGGSLTLTEKPNQPTLARGELEIIDGSYRAYGRSLNIRSGRIIFSQTAPENPRLEIEAVRTFRDVVAGVRVRGTAEDPELTLFSEPPMEETDILSYIVLGKPATGATGDRRQMLLQAATAAGFKGGNQLISSLEERLGLETLQLETEGSLEEGSLAIGKYLSPRLYVSYGVGLFDNQDQIKFRYEFDEHWTLEALGGEHTSADLFYRFRP